MDEDYRELLEKIISQALMKEGVAPDHAKRISKIVAGIIPSEHAGQQHGR